MGVSTKGVILTDRREFWTTSQRIGHVIYHMVFPEFSLLPLREKFDKKSDWRLPEIDVSTSFHSLEYSPAEYFRIMFTWRGEQRILHVHTDCDSDLKSEFGDDARGIILSFGKWGSSVELMTGILQDCGISGDKWILEADYNDDWRKL